MRVYVVQSFLYSDGEIHGVYLDKKQAEEVVRRDNEYHKRCPGGGNPNCGMTMEEHEVIETRGETNEQAN